MNKNTKLRLDLLLLKEGLVETRQKAQALILSGAVSVNGVVIDKSGFLTSVTSDIQILSRSVSRFVSRGGDKIDSMFDKFMLSVDGGVVIDVGASTGGFTDCVLRRGASLVYAVDVGYNQLDYRLRTDSRVVVMERVNARYISDHVFDPKPSFAVVDLSFISLRLVLFPVSEVLVAGSFILALVKPQFELSSADISKGGVVRSEEARTRAVRLVEEYAESIGLALLGVEESPLKGLKGGNQEYFLCMKT